MYFLLETLIWLRNFALFIVAAKILMQDFGLRLKERIYFLLVSVLIVIIVIVAAFREWNHLTNVVMDILFVLSIGLYVYKLKSYSLKKSIILTMLSVGIASLIFGFSSLLSSPFRLDWVLFLLSSLTMVVSLFLLHLIVRRTKNIRKAISENKRMQTFLLCILILFLVVTSVVSGFGFLGLLNTGDSVGLLRMFAVTVLLYGLITVSLSILFFKSLTIRLQAKHELQLKEAEQSTLGHYTSELEQQQTAMRNFKHDYQNILTSIGAFLDENDLAGLKEYYTSEIQVASEIITKGNLALEPLSKIKVREIKSILAAKLMLAQHMDVNAAFEADEIIDHIPADSVVLVRMLGILLDNAVEAVVELGHGNLRVACFKDGADILFIVQNTCRTDVPSLQQLEISGFSTKGEGRGLGLATLIGLANAESNITLETSVKDETFTQMIRVGGDT